MKRSLLSIIVIPVCLLVDWEAGASGKLAVSPDEVEAFRKYLVESLPKNSSWQYRSGTRAQRKELRRHLLNSVELKFFGSWRLIPLVNWSGRAGYPGLVTEDRRILFDPKAKKFVLGSLEWVNGYRKAHPIPVSGFDPDQFKSYLAEVVSVIPRLDCFGFSISKIEIEAPLRVRITYDPMAKRASGRRKGPKQEVIELNPDGSIKKSKLLERRGLFFK
jgi:hypothetical protein